MREGFRFFSQDRQDRYDRGDQRESGRKLEHSRTKTPGCLRASPRRRQLLSIMGPRRSGLAPPPIQGSISRNIVWVQQCIAELDGDINRIIKSSSIWLSLASRSQAAQKRARHRPGGLCDPIGQPARTWRHQQQTGRRAGGVNHVGDRATRIRASTWPVPAIWQRRRERRRRSGRRHRHDRRLGFRLGRHHQQARSAEPENRYRRQRPSRMSPTRPTCWP